MSDDIYIDVNYLTESERNIILQVLAKDDELRRQEKKRLSKLKTELDTIKYSGLEAQQLSANSKVCARCKEGFGTIFNTGAFCPKCKVRVCKNCRSTIDGYWVCLLCAKVREVKAKSGAWFFENEPKKTNKPALHGSVLLRASLKRTKKSALPPLKPVIAEPPPPPIINLNLKEHEKLHRPVAVHMSPLREAEDDQPYEVNSNYYKSNGHPTVEVNTRTVEETKKTSVDSRGSSTSSHSEYDQNSIDGSPLKYGNHDLVPPQITTTAISDDEGDKFGETQMDETQIDGTQRPRGNDEDIDQAFHDYGSSDFGGLKLQDRLEMGSRESIVSYYSDAGEGNYGNIPVTGEVQVGLRYDYKHEKLEVQVHRARDIAPVDTKKKRSDPYIKVYLLPDKTKGGKRKTKTKKHTLDPTFDEILQFKIGFDEMLTRTLWLTVWNHDRFGHNDFLGEIMLPLAQYDESGFNWAQPSAE